MTVSYTKNRKHLPVARLSVPRSQQALTLYTQWQTALLRAIYPVSAVDDS